MKTPFQPVHITGDTGRQHLVPPPESPTDDTQTRERRTHNLENFWP